MYEKLYRELLFRYNELEHENTRLSEENLQLRRRLGFAEISEKNIENSVTHVASVDKYSSSKEKIELFRLLFCGREDVFARRWQSTTSGNAVISLCVKTNGQKDFATKENTSVPIAQSDVKTVNR